MRFFISIPSLGDGRHTEGRRNCPRLRCFKLIAVANTQEEFHIKIFAITCCVRYGKAFERFSILHHLRFESEWNEKEE